MKLEKKHCPVKAAKQKLKLNGAVSHSPDKHVPKPEDVT